VKDWFTIAELKELALPDMPVSNGSFGYWAEQHRQSDKARKRAGRGGGFEYHVSLLPQAAQLRLKIMADAANGTPGENAAHKKALWDRYDALPQSHKLMCKARLKAISEVFELEAAGLSMTGAMAATASRNNVSIATLYNWRGLILSQDRTDWLAALAPSFTATAKRSDCDERAWEFITSDYLRPSRPAFSACYRRLVDAAKKEGWSPIPSDKSLMRRLRAEVPETVRTLARDGKEKAKKIYPAQRRTRAHLHAMQAVNMDGHKIDVFIKVPWSEKPVRMYLIGIQDLYSGKVLSWRISEAETWEAVRLVIGDMVEAFGIPDKIYLDNGRAFASKWISGQSRTRFRFKIKEEDPRGLLTELGIEPLWTTPYSGQSKPIERAWRDLAEEIAKHPFCDGAYTGNKPDAKPENYMTRAISLDEMRMHVAAQVARHNDREGRRAVACAGRSFDATFKASLADPSTIVSWPTEAQKSLWLLASEIVRSQRGSGEIHFQGNRYWHVALNAHAGKKVTLRFDPDRLHDPVKVYDLNNSLICEAECIEDVGFDNQDAARLHARARRDHLKAVQAQADAHQRLTAQELADIIYRGEKALDQPPQKPAVTRIASGGRAAAAAALPDINPDTKPIDFEEHFGRALRIISGGLDD
jgi:putative transposase